MEVINNMENVHHILLTLKSKLGNYTLIYYHIFIKKKREKRKGIKLYLWQ